MYGGQWSLKVRAGIPGLLTDPSFAFNTLVIIPAIVVQFRAVLIRIIVGFSWLPEADIEMCAIHPLPGPLIVMVAEANPGSLLVPDFPRLEEFLFFLTVDHHQLGFHALTNRNGRFPGVLRSREPVTAALEQLPAPGAVLAEPSQGVMETGQLWAQHSQLCQYLLLWSLN